jgi:hypothetical protein
MPEINVPEIEIPEAAAQLGKALLDGAYVAIGLAVLWFQRAQVHRVELQRQVEAYLAGLREQAQDPARVGTLAAGAVEELDLRLEAVREQLASVARGIDEQVGPARRQIDEGVDRMEAVLPDQARELVRMMRDAARRRERDLRSSMGLDDPYASQPPETADSGQPPADPQPHAAPPTEGDADPDGHPPAEGDPQP